MTSFASLGIGPSLCRAVAELDYVEPSPIQARAIPDLLDGRDLLGIAQTGTGKTAAFSLPILEQLLEDRVRAEPKRPPVLILAPTRELAGQIRDDIAAYARHTRLRHACIFGGVKENPQIRTLKEGVEILVATPGRLLDLAGAGHLELDGVTHLVLDEADRLLDMGFIRDIRRIIALLPKNRQSLLFSATMPREVADLARQLLDDPVRVEVTPKKVTVERIEQHVLMVENAAKQQALVELLGQREVRRAIVFTRTKHGANRVAKKLDRAGIAAEVIHGNKSQNARQRALDAFKGGDAWVLVATDIAARGIDIDGISHVINFELPHEPESYVHRIGRTARAGAEGVAWSLVDPTEIKRLRAIERLTKQKPKPLVIEGWEVPEAAAVADETETRTEAPRGRGRRNGARSEQQSGDGQKRSGGRRRRRRRRPAKAA